MKTPRGVLGTGSGGGWGRMEKGALWGACGLAGFLLEGRKAVARFNAGGGVGIIGSIGW